MARVTVGAKPGRDKRFRGWPRMNKILIQSGTDRLPLCLRDTELQVVSHSQADRAHRHGDDAQKAS